MPERSGMMKYELRKAVPVFRPVITTSATASSASVICGPYASMASWV